MEGIFSGVSLSDVLALAMFAGAFAAILTGFPVAFSLAGSAILLALLGSALDVFNYAVLSSIIGRITAILVNEVLVAVPLFIFMGTALERSKIAEELLLSVGQLLGGVPGGLGIAVIFVGALLAAATGIVGATVVTMGLISLPAMLKAGYDRRLAGGVICASGTLAQLIPPSTVLILLGIVLQNANTEANLRMGLFTGPSVTVTDLFAAALIPGAILVALYMVWMLARAAISPGSCPPVRKEGDGRVVRWSWLLTTVVPPLLLIVAVLGSILGGLATATESAAVGALGACLLVAARGQLSWRMLVDISRTTMIVSTMIFTILVAATLFSLIFRGFGGDDLIVGLMEGLPGGLTEATIFVLLVMFCLGFLLDAFEIIFIVVPIFAPVLITMGADPVWLGIAMALILQTSYLTPPFGFAIFYLQGTTRDLSVTEIYRGIVPFTVIQILAIAIVWAWPQTATWLPKFLFP